MSRSRRAYEYLCRFSCPGAIGKAIVHLENPRLRRTDRYNYECPVHLKLLGETKISELSSSTWILMSLRRWLSKVFEAQGAGCTLGGALRKCHGCNTLFHASPVWQVSHLGFVEFMLARWLAASMLDLPIRLMMLK